jgi:hypothetical protein
MPRLPDLPVALRLPEPLATEVAGFVESEAGWQIVGGDGPPDPVLTVVDRVLEGCACVVVTAGVAEPSEVQAALRAGALDVVAWPDERGRLLDAPLRVPTAVAAGPRPRMVTVAGAAGGVGTSTVALALAGLWAWAGRRVVVLGDDDLLALCGGAPWHGPGRAEVAALAAAQAAIELPAVARRVPGVRGLAVLGGRPAAVDPVGWPVDVAVVDAGRDTSGCDVLVVRADARLPLATATPSAGVVVTGGPAGRSGARRRLEQATPLWLPWSDRVAGAALRGRVPADLPGSFLARLRPLVPAGGDRSPQATGPFSRRRRRPAIASG